MSFLHKKKKGIGGMFFIIVSMASCFTMVFVIGLSRTSTVRSILDNFAYITANEMAIFCYNHGIDEVDIKDNERITSGSDSFKPLRTYNILCKDYFGLNMEQYAMNYEFEDDSDTDGKHLIYNRTRISTSPCKSGHFKWDMDTKVATLEFDEIHVDWTFGVAPDIQKVKIENK